MCPDRVHGEEASSCPGNTGGSWTGLRGKSSLGEQKTDISDHFLEVNNAGWLFCPRQGQLSNMEPTQDDVGPSAVLSPAGQRGGTAPASRLEYILFPCVSSKHSGSDVAGSDAELQPDARLLPVPAGQALRPFLRHRRQSAAVRTPRGHLQTVAHVAS